LRIICGDGERSGINSDVGRLGLRVRHGGEGELKYKKEGYMRSPKGYSCVPTKWYSKKSCVPLRLRVLVRSWLPSPVLVQSVCLFTQPSVEQSLLIINSLGQT
jgi:hypothetical protein